MDSPISAIEAPARATRRPPPATKPSAVEQHAADWSVIINELEAAMLVMEDEVPAATNLLIDAKDIATEVWGELLKGTDMFSPATLEEDDSRGSIAVCDIEARALGALDMRGTSALARTTLASVIGHLRQFGGESWQLLEAQQPAAQSVRDAAQTRSLGERRAGWGFSTISGLTESVRLLALEIVQDIDEQPSDVPVKADTVFQLATQIGALADIGMEDVGQDIMRRYIDVREWLLPPSYHSEATKEGVAA